MMPPTDTTHANTGSDGSNNPIDAHLRRLLDCVTNPRALAFDAGAAQAIVSAAQRVSAQFGVRDSLSLAVALAGGSGVGKSTIINALAGATIAEAAEQRPCTMQATVYHHRAMPNGGLPAEFTAEARYVTHERPELRFKVLVDTPDLDTFATQNRDATRAVLKAAGLLLYVFTPEKYWDERVWSVIREEQRFSGCLAIINKSDTASAHALETVTKEIRERFADLGKPDIAVLRIAAGRHVPSADGQLAPHPPGLLDEFPTLRAYIEHELHEGDLARMRRDLRIRVVTNLKEAAHRAIPPELENRLDELDSLVRGEASRAADELAMTLTESLDAVQDEFKPMINARRHQRFSGPFRAWLVFGDFVTTGLPRILRRFRNMSDPNARPESVISVQAAPVLARIDSSSMSRLRDAAFATGLPVAAWREASSHTRVGALSDDLARQLRERFEIAILPCPSHARWIARVSSAIGSAIPVGLAAYAVFTVVARMASGQPTAGFDMLGLVCSLTILSYIVLQGLTGLAFAGAPRVSIHELARQAACSVFAMRFGDAADRYRAAIREDVDDLNSPIHALTLLAEAAPTVDANCLPAPTPPGDINRLDSQSVTPKTVRSTDYERGHESVPPGPAAVEDTGEPPRAPEVAFEIPAATRETSGTPPSELVRPSAIFKNAVERYAGRASSHNNPDRSAGSPK